MTYILDLRKKINPQVQIVEKVIFQKQPWYIETLKVFLAILIVSSAVWGISKADDLLKDEFAPPEVDPTANITGIYGTVTATSTYALVLDDSQGSKYEGIDIFYADLTNLKTIQTNTDSPATLALSDIEVGDTIIARGIITGTKIDVQEIISFSATSSKVKLEEEVATTTATTTEEFATSTATTTIEEIATSTDTATTTSTSTPSIIENIITTITDTVQNTIQNIVDTLTGSSTPEEIIAPEVTPPVEEAPLIETPPADVPPPVEVPTT